MEQQAVQAASEAGLIAYISAVGILGGVTLAAAEGIGMSLKKAIPTLREKKWVKLALAVTLGPTLAMVAYGAGHLPSPSIGPWAWAFAGLLGLLGTFVAKGSKDAINKITGRRVKKRSKLP